MEHINLKGIDNKLNQAIIKYKKKGICFRIIPAPPTKTGEDIINYLVIGEEKREIKTIEEDGKENKKEKRIIIPYLFIKSPEELLKLKGEKFDLGRAKHYLLTETKYGLESSILEVENRKKYVSFNWIERVIIEGIRDWYRLINTLRKNEEKIEIEIPKYEIGIEIVKNNDNKKIVNSLSIYQTLESIFPNLKLYWNEKEEIYSIYRKEEFLGILGEINNKKE